jgi:hypothetical protein
MAYAIEWSENARSSRKLYLSTFPRFDQALVALEWGLARKPFLCSKIRGCSLRCMTIGPFVVPSKEVFTVKIFFKIVDTNKVSIEWLESCAVGDQ